MLKRIFVSVLILSGLLLAGVAPAESIHPLLYAAPHPRPALQAFIEKIQDPALKPLDYGKLPPAGGYYVRIAPRKYILAPDNSLLDQAVLGTKPFVFFTLPESLYGKSLLDIYLDIGYGTDDIIHWQRDEDMVAVMFRYPDSIGGAVQMFGEQLPDRWKDQVYVPTWDTIFALFGKLAAEASLESGARGPAFPQTFVLAGDAQRQFVLGFPYEGKDRIKNVPYAVLAQTGGADWVYRELLEKKLSILRHFRGNGRTQNELADPRGLRPEAGIREFVGPNFKIKDLPEVAVVHMGALSIR